jgi:hypothetical protein
VVAVSQQTLYIFLWKYLGEMMWEVVAEFIWLRIGTSGELL